MPDRIYKDEVSILVAYSNFTMRGLYNLITKDMSSFTEEEKEKIRKDFEKARDEYFEMEKYANCGQD